MEGKTRFETQYQRAERVGVAIQELDALTDQLASGTIDDTAAAEKLEALATGYDFVGRRVQARGLAAKPELNGRAGYVHLFSVARGRCVVQFDKGGEPMLLRPANLVMMEDAAWALDDDKQPRDWPHRPEVDPPSSFINLWRIPFLQGSQGAVLTPSCQCRQASCKCASTSCGTCVTDPVICWRCHRFFSLHCVGGGPGALVPTGGMVISASDPDSIDDTANMDAAVKMTRWANCPRCAAPLGAASMPKCFRDILSQSLHRGRTAPHAPGDASSMGVIENRALAVELKDALHEAEESRSRGQNEAAIESYTRAIRCVNLGRSAWSPAIHLMSDGFLRAHTERAVLEGDAALADKLRAFARAHRPQQTLRFRDASAFRAAFLTLGDVQGVFPGETLILLVGDGARPLPPGAHMPKPLSEDDDISYDLLSHECRDMNFWMQGGRPRGGLAFTVMFDFRWAFTTEAGAKDYFERIVDFRAEESSSAGSAMAMKRTPTLLSRCDTSTCVLLRAAGESTPGVTALSLNALFRSGRICTKFYASLGTATRSLTDEAREEAFSKLMTLAERALAKTVVAAASPLSVPCE